MQITSKKLKEHTQGIQDVYGKQEIKAISLGKQIFEKYGYEPIKLHNNNDQLFKGGLRKLLDRTDHGIDDVIFIDDIPENDPLNLKHLKKGRYTDMLYVIDYKSNNFKRDINSVYVKLMPYLNPDYYLKEYINLECKKVNPMIDLWEKDKENEDENRSKNRGYIGKERYNLSERYYYNRFFLDDSNKTDYFLYLKYPKKGKLAYNLTQAYLVPAEPLRRQIIDSLNDIFKKENSNKMIKLGDPYLNHRIIQAYLKVKRKWNTPKSEIELFRAKKYRDDPGDIMLRIPEHKLTSYIKFDNEGHIMATT